MINLSNVVFNYKKKNVLNNFNYTFNDKGLYVLKGKSGSGKTTLLNLIAGLLKPLSGSITYSEEIKNTYSSTSLIFQENNLFDHLTVKENIKVLFNTNSKNIEDKDITIVLAKLNIQEYIDTKVENISGGERQRVSIAIAILLDKKVILADEPFSSLDYDNSLIVFELFKELSKDRLIIFSSHNLSILENYDITSLDLEKEDFSDETNSLLLSEPVIKKNKLNLKTFLYVYKKIIGKRWVLKTLLFLFFTSFIVLVGIVFSIKLYFLKNVCLKTIKKDNIEAIDVYGDEIVPEEYEYYRIMEAG